MVIFEYEGEYLYCSQKHGVIKFDTEKELEKFKNEGRGSTKVHKK